VESFWGSVGSLLVPRRGELIVVSRIRRRWAISLLAGLSALVCLVPVASASVSAHKSVIPVRGRHRVANLRDWGFTVGVRWTQGRIVGTCTGVVIAPTKVLTAAHCAAPVQTIRVIANQITLWGGGGQNLGVASAAMAPDFGLGANGDLQNDLMVLTLASPTTAAPIRIASASEDAQFTRLDSQLAVAGFGSRNPFKDGKPKLGVLTSAPAFVRPTGCLGLTANLLCDSGPRSNWVEYYGRKRRTIQAIPCDGDSGGPLVARTASGPVLVGIEKAGYSKRFGPFSDVECGLKGWGNIHTRVAPYLQFIQANL
jgi:secreted trypsin-like serine protease